MKAYVFPVAPNPTKLRLYLAEKAAAGHEIPVEQVMVSLVDGEQNQPEHLARSPLGRLPVLELDDGSFLSESLAIIQYLEELHPEPPMIGREPLARARVRELEREIGEHHERDAADASASRRDAAARESQSRSETAALKAEAAAHAASAAQLEEELERMGASGWKQHRSRAELVPAV